jgi:hypothetical protein
LEQFLWFLGVLKEGNFEEREEFGEKGIYLKESEIFRRRGILKEESFCKRKNLET